MRMNRGNLLRVVLTFLMIAAVCASSTVFAGSFGGVYSGYFSGSESYGAFALLLRADNTGVMLVYDQANGGGFVEDSVAVNPDGTFGFIESDSSTSINGYVTSDGVSGSYSDSSGGNGTFYGEKSPEAGLFAEAGGYYLGPLEGTYNYGGATGPVSGILSMIIDATGKDFVLAQINGGEGSGGFLNVSSSGNINGILLDGVVLTGFLNVNSLSASGNFSFSGEGGSAYGTWNAQRQIPLPVSMSGTFTDVPISHWAYDYIEKLYAAGITAGCGDGKYCPDDQVTRAQMAVFIERAIYGSSFDPPPADGLFADVPVNYWAADWIEQFYWDGITSGCDTSTSKYCPDNPVTRAEMALFLLKAKHYGENYEPPTATGLFADVSPSLWAADWIEQLYHEGITTGCGDNPLAYCPDGQVTRGQMAAFLVRTLNLQ